NNNFQELQKEYEKNKNKPWREWLKISEIFSNLGKQGIAGLGTITSIPGSKIVFKYSQYMNYLAHHEISVMKSLNSVSLYCPHFCRGIGAVICNIDSSTKSDPFNQYAKHTIEKEVILMEHISKS